ncbi:MAG: hypothetical protein ACYS1E_09685, partial [Planctomycetota bacterium]
MGAQAISRRSGVRVSRPEPYFPPAVAGPVSQATASDHADAARDIERLFLSAYSQKAHAMTIAKAAGNSKRDHRSIRRLAATLSRA